MGGRCSAFELHAPWEQGSWGVVCQGAGTSASKHTCACTRVYVQPQGHAGASPVRTSVAWTQAHAGAQAGNHFIWARAHAGAQAQGNPFLFGHNHRHNHRRKEIHFVRARAHAGPQAQGNPFLLGHEHMQAHRRKEIYFIPQMFEP